MTTTKYRHFLGTSTAVAASPTPSASWNVTTGFTRRVLSRYQVFGSTSSETVTGPTTGVDRLARQFVGTVPRPGSYSGLFKLVAGCRKGVAGDAIQIQLRLRIFASDGTTLRGTLFDGSSGGGALSTNSGTLGNTISGALTPVAGVLSTDLLVAEVGFLVPSGTTSSYSRFISQAKFGKPDMTFAEGTTSTEVNPWMELELDDVVPSPIRDAASRTETLMSGERIKAASTRLGVLILEEVPIRLAALRVSAVADGSPWVRTAAAHVEVLYLERPGLRTVPGIPVRIKHPDGGWEWPWHHHGEDPPP